MNKNQMSKKDMILKMALREFSTNDYDIASVNKIIQDAHTSKGNFYYYFENKEELYVELVKKAWRKKIQSMNFSGETNIFEMLQKQVMAGIKFSKENPEYYQLSRQFSKEKNKKLNQRILEEISKESDHERNNLKTILTFDQSTIREEFSEKFVNNLIYFILNHMNEFIDDEDDIEKMEEKLMLILKVLKNGLEKN